MTSSNIETPFMSEEDTNVLLDDSVHWEDLPGGWQKRSARRKNESGRWDVTIITPDRIKIRSRVALIRYISTRKVPIDPRAVNFEQPFVKESSIKSHNTQKFIKEVEELQNSFSADQEILPKNPIPAIPQLIPGPTLEQRKKSVNVSPKKLRYLQRQFNKLSKLKPIHIDYLSRELKCPRSQIQLCFSLYEDFLEFNTSQKVKDPLEVAENEVIDFDMNVEDFDGFEVLNF